MSIKANEIKNMFISGCQSIIRNKDTLTEIDSTFGDGDHGITMEKIASTMLHKLQTLEEGVDLHIFFDELGFEVLCINGGSAAPLWGTFITSMALGIKEESKELSVDDIKLMFRYGLEELCDITTARIGDKTMMDTLILAVEGMNNNSEELEEVIKLAMEKAILGAKNSENYIAKYGRAKSYKEKTIGTPDAGAESMKYFFIGLYEGVK